MKKKLLKIGIIAGIAVLILSVIGTFVAPMLVSAADPVGDEVIEKRTRSSKTTYLGDGRYALDATIGSIHYEEDGQWQEIDNELVPGNAPWD